jgi:MFS family permease
MKKYLSFISINNNSKKFSCKFLLTATISAASGYISKINGFSRNAIFFLVYIFLISLSLGTYDVIFNLYILRLGFREDFLGLMLSLVSISTGLFAIPAATFCDRFGRKNTLLFSCLLLFISFAILYTTTSMLLLAFFSILYGISTSLKIVTASTFMVENSTSYERMHLFSMYYILYTIGVMLGNLAGGTLPQVFINSLNIEPTGSGAYQLSLYASLFAVLISLLPLLLIKDQKTKLIRKPELFSNLFSTLKSETIRKLIIVNGLIGLGWGLALPYFNVYFDVVLGASSRQIGLIFSLSQVVMMFTLLFVPILSEGLGKVKVVALVQLSSIPFLLLFTSTSILAIAAFGYIMRTAIMNMSNPILSSFNMEIVSEAQRATVNSLIWMSCYTCVGVSTYAGGLMMAHNYYTLPFLLTCILYIVASVLYYFFFEKIEKEQKNLKISF